MIQDCEENYPEAAHRINEAVEEHGTEWVLKIITLKSIRLDDSLRCQRNRNYRFL